jgi:hypothetical protein
MYIQHWGHALPGTGYYTWFIIAQTLVLTIVANVTGNDFNRKYGKNAELKQVEVNGTARMVDEEAPQAQEERARPANFGGGALPSVMQSVSGWMPSIMRGLQNTGMLGSILGGVANMFSGRQQTPPIRVNNPYPSSGSSSLPNFTQPSL